MLWLNRSRNNYWVYYGRYPQPLVLDYSFLDTVLRVISYSMLLIICERSALFWVRDESIVAYPGDDLDWRTIYVGIFGAC